MNFNTNLRKISFGIYEPSRLLPASTRFTPLLDVEDKNRGKANEIADAFSPDMEPVIADIQSDSVYGNRINLSDHISKCNRGKVTHNHYLGGPLTVEDVNTAVRNNFAEIRATRCNSGAFSSMQVPEECAGTEYHETVFLPELIRTRKEVFNKVKQQQPELRGLDRDEVVSNETWKQLAPKLGMVYSYSDGIIISPPKERKSFQDILRERQAKQL